MEYIKNTIEYPLYNSRAFQLYFGDMDIAMLDIETTGLSPKNSAFVLGGLASPDGTGLLAEQYFAESLSQEQETLQRFWQQASSKDVLITFNGRHFDMPFMAERLAKGRDDSAGYGTSPAAESDAAQGKNAAAYGPEPYHLDLFLLVKNFSPVRRFLPNLRQKTIEDFMGLWQYRKDEISGAESVELYYRFLSEKTDDIKEKILLHNHDDIVQLYRLLQVTEKCDLHRALFTMGFPVKAAGTFIVVESIAFKGGQLRITGRQVREPLEYRCYDYNGNMCYMHFRKDTSEFSIDLPVIEQSGLVLMDLQALGMDTSPLEKYPACREGFLIMQQQGEVNYMETNHFIKLFIERILSQWITDR